MAKLSPATTSGVGYQLHLADPNGALKTELIKSFDFYNDGKNSYRISVNEFNDVPYVGFGKFWFDCESEEWKGCKGKHFNFPASLWPNFTQYINEVSEVVNSTCNKANSGVLTNVVVGKPARGRGRPARGSHLSSGASGATCSSSSGSKSNSINASKGEKRGALSNSNKRKIHGKNQPSYIKHSKQAKADGKGEKSGFLNLEEAEESEDGDNESGEDTNGTSGSGDETQ